MNAIILSLFFAGAYLANAGYVKDVPCGQGTCPNGDTCCHGDPRPCCPTPNGVCCGHSTCCPSGYSCSGSMCVREEATKKQVIPKLFTVKNKKQLMRPSLKLNYVPCNGGYCPSGDTCCPKGGDAPCCPQFNAVCCGDGKSCCPSGYICSGGNHCEVASKNEVLQKIPIPFTKKLHNAHVKDIPCGSGYYCPDGQTCCPDGCCPLFNGVCCRNGYCCDHGYICNGDHCIRGEAPSKQVLKMLPTSFAKKEKLHNVTDIPCDGSTCPDGDTCCSGDTAPCCPTPNGVCCGNSTCCKTGQTCCPSTDNRGCCPYTNGVCCNNGCCPNGYSCNGDGCQRNLDEESAVLPQMKKLLPSTKTVKSKTS